MEKKIYIVQSNFRGGNTPLMAKRFDNIDAAINEYISQSTRPDCSFCNVVEVRTSLIVGNQGETDADTFKFV